MFPIFLYQEKYIFIRKLRIIQLVSRKQLLKSWFPYTEMAMWPQRALERSHRPRVYRSESHAILKQFWKGMSSKIKLQCQRASPLHIFKCFPLLTYSQNSVYLTTGNYSFFILVVELS